MMNRTLLVAAALAVATLAQAKDNPGVEVKDAWVRGTVPGQTTTAAYMTLRASESLKVVGISTPAAQRAEIHSSEMKDGVMRMRPVKDLRLPAGKNVALQGEMHLMLLELARTLGAGDAVHITITVEDAKKRRSRVEVEAPVRPLGQ